MRVHDVVLESFRPGVLERLGVGYERMREENPGIVYCAISGYGQGGVKRDASGHDMNYLGLVGLLGLTGERGGEPVQAAGQIADVGGGSLMAAFGIMAALRERDGAPGHPGSGEGQLVDVSMSDGALSWLALVAGAYFADQTVPRRGDLPLAGSLICYRPYECADGWVSLGALEPKFWQAFCRGVGHEELIAKQFERPGSEAHARVREIFMERKPGRVGGVRAQARLLSGAGARARRGAGVTARGEREMVVEIDQPGAEQPVRQLGIPVKLARTPGEHDAASRTGARRAHRGGAARCRLLAGAGRRAAGLRRGRRRPRPGGAAGLRAARAQRAQRTARAHAAANGQRSLLKMSELARALGREPGDDPLLPARGPAGGGEEICARVATWPTTRPRTSSGSR